MVCYTTAMETVTVDNTTYKKASVLAREFRYTPDYLGQLCRGKKVDAHLLGRTWYVNPESLEAHRQQRYHHTRTNEKSINSKTSRHAESVQADRQRHSTGGETTTKLRVGMPVAKRTLRALESQKHFYEHASDSFARYAPDGNELVPTMRKTAAADVGNTPSNRHIRIHVAPYGAYSLAVTESAEQTAAFTAAAPEPVALHGTLTVEAAPGAADTDEAVDGQAGKANDEPSSKRDILQNKGISDERDDLATDDDAPERASEHRPAEASNSVSEEDHPEMEVAADSEAGGSQVQPSPGTDAPYAVAISHRPVLQQPRGRRDPRAGESAVRRRSPYQPRYAAPAASHELEVASLAVAEGGSYRFIRYAPAVALVFGLLLGAAILSAGHVLRFEDGVQSSEWEINMANLSSLWSG